MQFVADLHLHSKYSRAVSQDMVLAIMAKFAKKKGIDILATADWTHPLWLREIKSQLEEKSEGLFKLKVESGELKDVKETLFILSTEISSIYSQGGKVRRIHNLIFSPKFETCEKINQELNKRGCNLYSDGRPIIGLSSKNLLELVLSIDEKTLFIPAHCLTPDSLIHTKNGMKKIKDVVLGEEVYTHKNRTRKITNIFRHSYDGELLNIRPWYFSLGLATTPEHPFLALKVKKCSTKGGKCLPTNLHKKICKCKLYESYKSEWIKARDLSLNDVLVFPRFKNTTSISAISLNTENLYKQDAGNVYSGGTRGHVFSSTLGIDKNLCRIIGYYLAEGYTNGRDEVAFSFNEKEKKYISNVIFLMGRVFGISHYRIYRRKQVKGIEISFYSKLLVAFFQKHFYVHSPYRAINKIVPDWMLHLPEELQVELLRGWWRGDQGYTSSFQLMNTMKIICLRIGIVPSIHKDTKENHLNRGKHQYKDRIIYASKDAYIFSHLAFFEDPYRLLVDPAFKRSIRKIDRRHGWIDKDYVYLPIRKIERIPYSGEVFNIEVAEDNSYVAEFAAVHNCWTPWFALYGSNSGFDSIEECFGEFSKYIYAVETGLSSDPSMNWRIKELESRSIISSSDSHSPAKMGREATVFVENKNGISNQQINFDDIAAAIKKDPSGRLKIGYTIEFYPEEGKYHYTGHRNCKIVQDPLQTKEKGVLCPSCHKPLTVGVMHRVGKLADYEENVLTKMNKLGIRWFGDPKNIHPPFVKLVPLLEIVAESLSSTVFSQKVKDCFDNLCSKFGSEVNVLLKTKIEDVEKDFGEKLAEGIAKVRSGEIVINPGYDGEYGKVKIWAEEKESKVQNRTKGKSQLGLF